MSDDRTWYPGDPDATGEPGDGSRGPRGRGSQQGRGPRGYNPQDPYEPRDPYASGEQPSRYGRGGQPPARGATRSGGSTQGTGQAPGQVPGQVPGQGRRDPRGYDRSGAWSPQSPQSGGRSGAQPGRRGPSDYGYDDPADAFGATGRQGRSAGRGTGRSAGAWTPADVDDEPDEGADYPAAGSVPRARGGRQVRGSSAAGRAFTDSGAEALGEAQPVGNVNPDLDLDELDPTGKVRKAAAANRARPPKKSSRKRAAAKWTAISMASVLVAILVFAAYVYQTTIGDMKHTSLLPSGVSQAALPVDPYGNSAMNILLIGSDTRDTAQNCALGGACPNGATAGANGDAELILHVSADRTNATVMSIPRDTYTTVPQCATDSSGNVTITGYVHAQINSALQYGPECQVAADHDLTGITITGYIMFDFAGVVQMSNALGGVPVCVTTAVHDKYSGLNLPAGVSTVQGISALEFLRTRHSFFDGSDLGREEATHYFFSQMINTIRSKLNLSSAATLLAIGQAAASSVTVSNNFSGLSNLQGLVENLNRVPTSAITFVTMPWGIDPNEQSWVIPSQPAANQMFQNIQNDVPYSKNAAPAAGSSAAATKTSAAPAAPPGVVDANVPVAVYNADGVTGRAGQVANTLNLDGFNQAAAIGNWPQNANTTRIYYPSGDAAQAQAVAAALKIPAGQVQQSSQYTSVTVAVGLDFESGSTYAASAGSPAAGGGTGGSPAAGVAVAPPSSSETNATGSGSECIPSAPNGMNPGTLTMAHN